MKIKTKATAAMLRMMRESTDLDGDCSGCRVPMLRVNPSGIGGANWQVGIIDGTPRCAEFLHRAIYEAKKEYELIDG